MMRCVKTVGGIFKSNNLCEALIGDTKTSLDPLDIDKLLRSIKYYSAYFAEVFSDSRFARARHAVAVMEYECYKENTPEDSLLQIYRDLKEPVSRVTNGMKVGIKNRNYGEPYRKPVTS